MLQRPLPLGAAPVPVPHLDNHFEDLKPYSFGYEVKDPEGALDFGHRETSDGITISGVYHVLLPDGRHQTVTYTADHDNGYRATVEYSGGVAAVPPVPPPPPGAGAVALPVAPTVTPLPFRAIPVSAVPSPIVRTSKLRSGRAGGAGGNRLYKYSIKERNRKKVKKGTKRRTG